MLDVDVEPGRDAAAAELRLREQLSNVRGLLALSMLMTERRQQEEIVHLLVTAVPSLVRVDVLGVHLVGEGSSRWLATAGACEAPSVRAELAAGLAGLPPVGGDVDVSGAAWAFALALRSLGERLGHLVVSADGAPEPADLLLLRSVAQQAGIALANATLHERNRRANEELARTVSALRHKTAIHDRLTRIALSDEGHAGIASALYELTGLPACIETRGGEVLAWAGPSPAPPGSRPSARRDRVIDRAIRAGHPIRHDGRLLTVARPRSDVVGVISLMDPEGHAGEQETVALEHAGTVLAIELARLHSLAETELRLGRDLAADLVAGADESAQQRAQALGHDLTRPHRVLVAMPRRDDPASENLLLRVREALTSPRLHAGGPTPLIMRSGAVVVALVPVPAGSSHRTDTVDAVARSTGPGCRIGVGGVCTRPDDVPRSYREAMLALRVAQFGGHSDDVVTYEDLGVFQLLAEVSDPAVLDEFVRRWLGPLQDYDAKRRSELVITLATYLDNGGSYDATATALALGRTTVRYRLRRIQQLTGHDLSRPETRFQVHLATKAWTTLRSLDRGGV